jgi:hypothetical protein
MARGLKESAGPGKIGMKDLMFFRRWRTSPSQCI